MKRKRISSCVDNPFIKEENRSWSLSVPRSLTWSVSPPLASTKEVAKNVKPVAAEVEAGERTVEDHLTFFSQKLSSACLPASHDDPRLSHEIWINLYSSNHLNPRGNHFVVHQHDHPVAGIHYDLRLQCNATSSVSWAIMYGLPGDPNSQRLNRNATETRIHCLWNHLIETASHQTGSLLIWDTGTYEVLPYHDSLQDETADTTDSEPDHNSGHDGSERSSWSALSEPQKLHQSFNARRIRLRLHGTKLPPGYTLSLWLRRRNDRMEQPKAPKTRRRRVPSSRMTDTVNTARDQQSPVRDIDSGSEHEHKSSSHAGKSTTSRNSVHSLFYHESPPPVKITSGEDAIQDDDAIKVNHPHPQGEMIRLNNAYIGASNTINSIHQRKWYLALDRVSSGFIRDSKSGGRWVSQGRVQDAECKKARKGPIGQSCGFKSFHVLGRDHEKSIVTGRLASDILKDEGVVGYVPRGKWRPVIE